MPFNPPSEASPRVKTLASYFDALSRIDIDAALAYCDDETFENQILPLALGRPKQNKREFGDFMRGFRDTIDALNVTVHRYLETEDNALTVHAQSDGISKLGTPWHNEYIFIFNFTPGESPKITRIQEFVHSAFVVSFRAEEMKKRELLSQR